MTRYARAWLSGVAFIVAPVAFAHHSFAMFDQTKTVTIEGTVKELQLVNPHSWLQILVTDSSGKVTEWSFEAGGPQSLYRQGFKKSSVRPGDKISVEMHPLRDGRPGGSLVGATLADGTHVSTGIGVPPAANPSPAPAAQ
jgi:Family of unknown function (DUF6152)